MDNMTLFSNQSHNNHNNNDGTNVLHANTNATTSEGDGGHCISNENCVGVENMDSYSDHQDLSQGELKSKISEKCNMNQYIFKTGDTSDDVRDEGTLIIVERDGEKEGSGDKHLDGLDQGMLKAILIYT